MRKNTFGLLGDILTAVAATAVAIDRADRENAQRRYDEQQRREQGELEARQQQEREELARRQGRGGYGYQTQGHSSLIIGMSTQQIIADGFQKRIDEVIAKCGNSRSSLFMVERHIANARQSLLKYQLNGASFDAQMCETHINQAERQAAFYCR